VDNIAQKGLDINNISYSIDINNINDILYSIDIIKILYSIDINNIYCSIDINNDGCFKIVSLLCSLLLKFAMANTSNTAAITVMAIFERFFTNLKSTLG